MGLLHPLSFARTQHGLPTLPPPPITMYSGHETSGQRQSELISEPSSMDSTDHPLPTRTAHGRRSLRRCVLEEEAYPLKLIRELDKISSKLPHISEAKPVFGVIHVNSSTQNGLSEGDDVPYHLSPKSKPIYPTGGVALNKSHWEIYNKCLSLKHLNEEGESKVFAMISYVQDHGIQI
ncbi:hypothetical protein F5Y19DRAFT_433146 [Xylariaceae sp. FL1651]|nr:hypothetical protein F5Y19DRAFT_433146 [Xylariaceae sp. FL1651]